AAKIRSARAHESIATLGPQAQAETLLEESLSDYDSASRELMTRMEFWRGQLTMTPRLTALLDSALNAKDLRERSAAIELELVAYDLPKTEAGADVLFDRIESDPAGRPWALWMLGAMGNRGVETERALSTLVKYSHDANEKTRYWAVEGLS